MTKCNFTCKEVYASPVVEIVDVQVEGVLCESGISIEKWKDDDELLDFD